MPLASGQATELGSAEPRPAPRQLQKVSLDRGHTSVLLSCTMAKVSCCDVDHMACEA